MSNRKCSGILVAGMAALLLVIAPTRAERPEDQKPPDELVSQLGSRSFQEREQASKSLIMAGPSALKYLQKATKSSDAEIRRRAGLALERIEKEMDTARLLKPHRVHLVYRDTPITEAVADFAKKSGFPLLLEGDRVRLANRKITLDTGEVTFWEALDQFCRAAGLVEHRGPPAGNAGGQAVAPQEMERLLLERRMIRKGFSVPPARVDFSRLVLVEGQEDPPTSQCGAVRIRALRLASHPQTQLKSSEEALIHLEISPEPSVDWRGVLAVHVDKAIDAHSREVEQIVDMVSPPSGQVVDWGGGAVAFNLAMANNAILFAGDLENIGTQPTPSSREFPLRLKKNEASAKALREIRGVIFAQVQTPNEPVIKADKILQAESRTFKGPENSYLKVHEARKTDGGQIKLRVTVRAPSMSDEATAMMGGAIFVRRFNGRMAFIAQQEAENVAAQSLSLQDANGRSYHLVSAEETAQANAMEVTQEFHLVFQSRQGLGEPAYLVYTGHRLVTVEIPFTLKNVPLSSHE
jgi:hypothetical protein